LSKSSPDAKDSVVSFWRRIVSAIEDLAISDVYEKVNNIMSLGQVKKLRARIVAYHNSLVRGKIVVDLGSGKGHSAIEMLKHEPKIIVLLDPSPLMLTNNIAYATNSIVVERVVGVAEHLPLRDKAVEAIFSFFVLRDLLDLCCALREIVRASRKGVLVDVIRPSSRLWDIIISTWFCAAIPLIAGIIQGVSGYKSYNIFCRTVRKWLTKEELAKIVRKCCGSNFVIKTHTLGVVVELTLG